jgi:Immunoglobulin domain
MISKFRFIIFGLLMSIGISLFGQDQSATAGVGKSITFTVTTSGGTQPFTYLWKKNGVTIVGATTNAYTIPAAALGDAGTYTVTVSNSAGSATSNNAIIAVQQTPIIATQPANVIAVQGGSAVFTVLANGTPPPSFQWCKSTGGVLTPISGATGLALTLLNVQTSNSGSYVCVITNAAGSVTSNAATLLVTIPVTVPAGVKLTANPSTI